MRDIFEDIYANEPTDPMESARRGARPTLRKRFFEKAGVSQEGSAFAVVLDGKSVKTPARRALAAPTQKLAQEIANEWGAQRELIDPAAMPLTRLANAVIDAVADNPEPVAQEIESYLGTDMVFYRADTPEGLVARQAEIWDPILEFARDKFGARFVLAQGVIHAAQPKEAVAAAAKAISREPWRLGALSTVTTLTGSALIALALAHGRLDAQTAWAAAHVDEDWNMQTWGRDEMALKRRDGRFAEMQAAATVLALTR